VSPLILITNDDGIDSPGLLAAVEAVHGLGEILVVAPEKQQSGAARSHPSCRGRIRERVIEIERGRIPAFSLEGSPAQAVQWGILKLRPRRPDLVVSGINYGENVGSNITVSGTIGAAIEVASYGIPTLAVSLETEPKHHFSHSKEVDFSAAAFFTRIFAEYLLSAGLPEGVDILKVDVPQGATPETPWRLTRVSRQKYYHPTIREGNDPEEEIFGYRREIDFDTLEPDSDIYALSVDRVVSVSPLTIDLTAKVDLERFAEILVGRRNHGLDLDSLRRDRGEGEE